MATSLVGIGRVQLGSEAMHANPIWRERSDFILFATVDDSPQVATEQLWARRLTGLTFEVCCIPFFVYDLSLGDIVETDSNYQLTRVVEASGRFTFRLWFGDSFHPRDRIVDELTSIGALVEWSSPNLVAVDASDESLARKVADYLADKERDTVLIYETGRSV